jgi:flavoprotein
VAVIAPPPPPVKEVPIVVPKKIPLIKCRYCEVCVPKPEIVAHEALCFDKCKHCGERMLKKILPEHEA